MIDQIVFVLCCAGIGWITVAWHYYRISRAARHDWENYFLSQAIAVRERRDFENS